MSPSWKWACLIFFCAINAIAQNTASHPGSALLGELGCAYCHRDLRAPSTLRELTPDLSTAGFRYNPAYLFDYLQNPTRVRLHLGKARMPNFRFSEKETLALVAFLEAQRFTPANWPLTPTKAAQRALPLSASDLAAAKVQTAVCLGCHSQDGKGGNRAIDLANITPRLQPNWVRQFLVSPPMFGVAATNMPALFYRLTEDHQRFEPNSPDAAERIQLVSDYLFSLNQERRQKLEASYAAAKARFPNVRATLGEAIFRSQNCAACHRHISIQPREDAAPELSVESGRVNQSWLTEYLRQPSAIRPFGFHPGDGSRMPDFHLDSDEARQIAGFLGSLQPKRPESSFQPKPLSAFSMQKAHTLLTEKLSCLGCHSLGGQGGKIGPDLSLARTRLQPSYIYSMIVNPRAANPHTIMPRLPIPEATVQLITNFLLQQDSSANATPYLSLAENALLPPRAFPSDAAAKKAPRDQYLAQCAVCHGPDGNGTGFNARFLPQAPTAHANPDYMSSRPDDTLYDGIASGGAILNKSHFMPAWGQTLSPAEIKSLVAYMRSLCRCEGPAWSRANNSAAKLK